MRLWRIAGAGAALLLVAACGRGEERAGQPTAEENEKLENIAGKVEGAGGEDTFDTSPDSAVPVEDPASVNGSVPAAPANQTGPTNQAAPPPSVNGAESPN